MRNPVDYFGLVAYMFVMYGGLPGSDSLWSESRETGQAKRGRPKLRVIRPTDDPPPARRRRAANADAREVAA
jgi:hypothetical protein